MLNKNSYIIIYTVLVCVLAASVLAVVKQTLTERQNENIAYDNKKKILNTRMDIGETTYVNWRYVHRVKAFVMDLNGNKL